MVSSNNMKYVFTAIILLALLPYLQIFLVMMNVDANIIAYVWIAIFVFLAFTFTIVPLREYNIHQKPAAGKEFQLGPIVWMNCTSQDKLLGIQREVVEMKFDWTDTGITMLEASKLYLRAKREVLKKESRIAKEKRQQINIPDDLKTLVTALDFDVSDPPLEQVAQILATMFNIKIDIQEEPDPEGSALEAPQSSEAPAMETEEDYKKTLLQPKSQNIVMETKRKKMVTLKPEFINFAELGIVEGAQKELLKSMYIYNVHLYHPETLEGYEFIEFSQAFYILPGAYKEILATRPMKVYDYDDYLIDVQGCSCMWCCCGFIKGKVPLLLLCASENLVKMQTVEVIKSHQMKNSTMYYMRIKIMEWLLNQQGTEQDPFMQKIDTLETQNSALRDSIDYMIQDYMTDTFIKAPRNVQKHMYDLNNQLNNSKKWKPLAIIAFILLFIMVFALFFVLIPIIGGGTGGNIPPPKDLSLILNYKKLRI